MSEISLKEWVNERLTSARDHVDTVDRLRAEALELARKSLLEALGVEHRGNAEHFKTLNGHADALRKQQETYVQLTVYDRDLQELKKSDRETQDDIDALESYRDNQQGRAAASGAVAGVLAGAVVAVVVSLVLRAIP